MFNPYMNSRVQTIYLSVQKNRGVTALDQSFFFIKKMVNFID